MKMVEITGFSRLKRTVVVETDEGKVRLTFDEWKKITDAYLKWVGNEE